ncbi:NAD(P)/FAD-dependent oxidoreductase [Ancylobacter terrae]|uniref:NAD(P)/FAD-dependent oxidoreductase n=1 Tax=Ancylobacter sp. sgz301288 TaxID=3342077 RepID=UPI003858A8EC
MLDANKTEQKDLRGGESPWQSGFTRPRRRALDHSLKCDVLVVGGGITGALVAQHLTALGRQVCLIDRERVGFGSTAASTAMLQWEIDCSLGELTALYGFDRAANIFRQSFRAVAGLRALVQQLGIACAFRARQSLYLAVEQADPANLRAESSLRDRADLPGVYLDYLTLKREFDIEREAAIVSPGSAEADPLLLTHGLIASALANGASIYDAEAIAYSGFSRGALVGLDNGCEIEARHVVLASGYVMPAFLTSELHTTASSWALATAPQPPGALWHDGALIWEASDDYHYARTTVDGRIIIGGEDDDQVIDPNERDALTPAKREALLRTLKSLRPEAELVADYMWSGAFGQTVDGLPLIGETPTEPNIFAAYGYGGNGITFSFLAAHMLGNMIRGHRESWYDDLAIDRSLPGR